MAATTSDALISIYKRVNDIKSQETIPLDIFFENIRTGFWQDIVLPIRAIADKKERDIEKQATAPCVTISGMFKQRVDGSIDKHSGFIGIDLDDVADIEKTREYLSKDRYVVAVFTSISGRGLCVVFNVNPSKHREAFRGLGEYLYDNYRIVSFDTTSVNVSRARFVSFDPEIFFTDNYDKFVLYPKDAPPKKVDKVIFAKGDFEELIKQITIRRLNLCESYYNWLRIGFSIAHKFGEAGREYFHIVSQYSAKYNSVACDKQYSACLRNPSANAVTISTFYYYCKQAGLQVYSEQTKLVSYASINGKKSGLSPLQVAVNLEKIEGITGVDEIINEVFSNDTELNEGGIITQLEMYLRQTYNFRRNAITRFIEKDGINVESVDLNTIFIEVKKIMPKITRELFDCLINSHFIPTYNPFHEFFQANIERTPVGVIDKLFGTIRTKDSEHTKYFCKKWIVGMIALAHGKHTPLMPVLSGDVQNTGKTQFWKRFLPEELKKYYAKSKLDREKDDEILMCQKWLVLDDEMGGKTKKDHKKFKNITDSDIFTLREPYGRNNVDLIRLAAMCGTTNDNEILGDPTGNRRVIPIHVFSIDHDAYNKIDKVDLLMEAFHLWNNGFIYELNSEDIALLNKDQISFEVSSMEKELIQKYFEHGTTQLTSTEIKIYLEDKTRQKLTLDAIGKQMKNLKFHQKHVDDGKRRVWLVEKTDKLLIDLPF